MFEIFIYSIYLDYSFLLHIFPRGTILTGFLFLCSLFFIFHTFLCTLGCQFFFYIICWLLQMSYKRYLGFPDGASRHTCNLASTTWVIYSPSGQLVAVGGTCLGPASNNVAEYRAVIELLWDSLS